MMNKITTKQYKSIIITQLGTTKCSRVEALSEKLCDLRRFVPSQTQCPIHSSIQKSNT